MIEMLKIQKEKGAEKMFRNVGKKIQGVAIFIFVLCLLGSVGLGITFFVAVNEMTREIGLAILALVATIAIGTLLSWMSLLGMYAYGKIAECVEAQNRLTEKLIAALESGAYNRAPASAPNPAWDAPADRPANPAQPVTPPVQPGWEPAKSGKTVEPAEPSQPTAAEPTEVLSPSDVVPPAAPAQPVQRRCRLCGAALGADSAFCPNCGTKV